MPLLTVIPLNGGVGRRFTLHQLVWWDDRSIGGPLVRAVHLRVPLRKTVNHLLQRCFVPSPTFPVEQLPRVAIQRFPDLELVAFRREVMPHLIKFQDDGSPRRLRLLLVWLGQGAEPGKHGLG